MKNWLSGWACNLNDLFVRFPYSTCKYISKKWKKREEQLKIIKQVFRECVDLVINDIIDNNVTFKIQGISYQGGEIHMESIQYEDFETCLKRGKFRDIDFWQTNFTGYQMFLYIHGKSDNFLHRRKFPVYFNRKYREKLSKYVNEGKGYC